MRYTHHRGLARVTSWVRLKFAAMNLKKLAIWSCKAPVFPRFFSCFFHNYAKTPVLAF
ncbi:MAG: IS5/IS1182 family transposase, partial [Dysosmobacter sp.]|nr:IS5/IS1182 family transposase [Dysosmobacter sp.]